MNGAEVFFGILFLAFIVAIIILYFKLLLDIAEFGKDKGLSFGATFFIGLLFSPVMSALYVIASPGK